MNNDREPTLKEELDKREAENEGWLNVLKNLGRDEE